jgi:hypothetical protein
MLNSVPIPRTAGVLTMHALKDCMTNTEKYANRNTMLQTVYIVLQKESEIPN